MNAPKLTFPKRFEGSFAIPSNESYLIQVDFADQPISVVTKREAHLKGILHRAFSIFIFRRVDSYYQLLLQQRAWGKYHSGGLWTNTCCSHVVFDHPIELTAQSRLKDEMGFECPLSCVGSFYYKADLNNEMIEHEIDHVFAAIYDPPNICLNRDEAIDFKWIEINSLKKLLVEKPHEFTAWLANAFMVALKFNEIN